MNQTSPSALVGSPRRPSDRKPFRRLFTTAAAAALAAAALTAAGGCATSDADRQVKIVQLKDPSFARQWASRVQLDRGDKVVSVFLRENYLFIYTDNAKVYGVKRDTGAFAFAVNVDGGKLRMYAPVLLTDRFVIPTTNTLEIFKLDGEFERSLNVRAAIRSDCVGALTSVYVPVDSPEGGARIKRFDLLDPSVNISMWQLMAWEGAITSAPALQTDSVYMAADAGHVYALSATTREPLWGIRGEKVILNNIFDAQSPIVAPLRADDVGVYVPTLSGKFYCLGLTNGQVKWQYYAKGPLEQAAVVTRDTVYIFDPDLGLTAVDKVDNPDIKVPQFNRKARWINKDIRQIVAQDDKYLYATDAKGHLVAYDRMTGERRFAAGRKDFYLFATNTRDGTSYTVSESGRILAIRPVLTPGQTGEVVMLDEDKEPVAEVAGR